jgi:hypothetical protein
VREDDQPIGYLILTLGYSVEYGGRDGCEYARNIDPTSEAAQRLDIARVEPEGPAGKLAGPFICAIRLSH